MSDIVTPTRYYKVSYLGDWGSTQVRLIRARTAEEAIAAAVTGIVVLYMRYCQ